MGCVIRAWEEPLDAVSVPEGRLVSRGQLLFPDRPRPFEVALDTAVAQLRQAEVLAPPGAGGFRSHSTTGRQRRSIT